MQISQTPARIFVQPYKTQKVAKKVLTTAHSCAILLTVVHTTTQILKTRGKTKMKKIINFIKALWNGRIFDSAVNNGLVSFEGCGRNKYGK